VLAVGFPLLVQWAGQEGWISSVPTFLYPSTALVAIVTTVIYLYLYRLNKPSMFVQFYLLSMVIKIVTALVWCWLMVSQDRENSVVNVVYFLVLYVSFTVLEILLLHRKIGSSGRP
jgi:hypothetical protein